MKRSIVFLLIFTSNYYFSQTVLVDIETKQVVSNTHVLSDLGVIVDISDKNGNVDIEKIQNSKLKHVIFHHISYNDFRLSVDSLNLTKVVYLVPKVTYLQEFVISDEDPLYIKITGYFRSYTLRNDIPVIYRDGIISYYVPLKKKKDKIKTSISEYRSFINLEEKKIIDKTPASKLFYVLRPITPKLSKSIIGNEAIIKNNAIFNNSDSIGSIIRNDRNQSITVNIDYLGPDSVKVDTLKYASMVFRFTNWQSTKVFNDTLELINLMRQTYVLKQEMISLETNVVSSLTIFNEFNVTEVGYIYSKKEINKSHTYGNFHSYYTSNYWESWEEKSFIDNLLDKILIEQPMKKID